MEAPKSELRLAILQQVASAVPLSSRATENLSTLARRCAGRGARDLEAMVGESVREASLRLYSDYCGIPAVEGQQEKQSGKASRRGGKAGAKIGQVEENDLERALSDLRPSSSNQSKGGSTTVKVPEVRWEDIGGLSWLEAEIKDMVELPLRFPDLFRGGLRRRSGILHLGPPGTGKNACQYLSWIHLSLCECL